MRSNNTPLKLYCDPFQDISEENEEEEDSRVDFLSRLGIHGNYTPVLKKLLSYLDPKDLSQACLVSRNWNQVITSDRNADQRRMVYINEMKALKRSVGEVSFMTAFISKMI